MALDGIGSAATSAPAVGSPPETKPLADVASELAALRLTDPGAAAVVQTRVEAAMTPVERGQLAAAVDAQLSAALPKAGWREAFDTAMAGPRSLAAFQAGVRDGVIDGAKSFVVGTATLIGKTVQFGADSGPAGWLGDKLRSATGNLPGVVDAIVPSGRRGAETAESLRQTAGAITEYAISRARDPSKLLADTEGFIQKNWDTLKAGHAAAAAKGMEAEAKWWGQIMGRAAFEIGITVVPIAGQAGKVGTGARAVDGAVTATRVADDVAAVTRSVAGQTVRVDAGDVAANAARHAQYLKILGVAEKANPLVDALRTTGKLPDNFVTKAEAELAGWRPGKALHNAVPGGQLGGDVFRNSTGVLPSAPGRVWFEADVGLNSAISRAKQAGDRLLYSSDGLLYVTADHYKTAHPVGTWK